MNVAVLPALIALVLLAACQTKGEHKAPCPALSSYYEQSPADTSCGPLARVNDPFPSIVED